MSDAVDSFEIDRGDMRLLIEAGYSSVMRSTDVDTGSIFRAIDEWMPQYAAGPIGLALQQMVAGDLAGADTTLAQILASDREGRSEAAAILAMCKKLLNDETGARRLAEELEGSGGHAEAFADLLVNGVDETTQGDEGLALEAAAAGPSRAAVTTTGTPDQPTDRKLQTGD